MKLSEIPVPDSPAAAGALEVSAVYCPPALHNHAVRSYLWAAAYAIENGIAFDAELLYVAAVLHDIGLVKEFDSHTVPFEAAGGHVAWVFAAGAGWPAARRERVAQVIERHMWDAVDLAEDPEGHLLELSTAMEISGRGVEWIPAGLRAEVLEAYPRLGLAAEFTASFEDQAARKPDGRCATFIRAGLATRLAANPLDS
ncbi:HD domain-containing protein [Bailinhaonella thermotolerans]|uniref:HD domain-containing protein n=1 Tax=Bailinhaonella thermotolerans TaxID=1070861 RepID=A0A3A4AYY7_9ACTN|nr:HD domain-containing protein [Bailinhaonella thermotolerans]RJL35892.1 HD domain-containing protein [Bailinhaonella thermotolerans]